MISLNESYSFVNLHFYEDLSSYLYLFIVKHYSPTFPFRQIQMISILKGSFVIFIYLVNEVIEDAPCLLQIQLENWGNLNRRYSCAKPTYVIANINLASKVALKVTHVHEQNIGGLNLTVFVYF